MIEQWQKFAFNPWSMIIPIVLVIIVISSAIISGIRRGIYGGIITASFGVGGWLIGFALSPVLASSIIKNVKFEHKEEVIRSVEELKPFLMGLMMLAIQIPFLIIGGILILILHNVLHKPIKRRKENHISTVGYRSIGAVIGTVGVIPCSILVANVSGVVTTQNRVINANDKMLEWISFNKAKGASLYTPGLIASAKLGVNVLKGDDNKTNYNDDISDYFREFVNPKNYIVVNRETNQYVTYNKNIDLNIFKGTSPKYDIMFYFSLDGLSKEDVENKTYQAKNLNKLVENVRNIIVLFRTTKESFDIFNIILKLYSLYYSTEIKNLVNYINDVPDSIIQNANLIDVNIKPEQQLKLKSDAYLQSAIQIIVEAIDYELKQMDNISEDKKKIIIDKTNVVLNKIISACITVEK
ncbi:hypothetical protein [Mycoplasmopsis adleri]|uniref:hypothetical protein n=1 Tax=Mycoplasmopsis adleri TaxID=51362 RepID=UPI0038731BC6